MNPHDPHGPAHRAPVHAEDTHHAVRSEEDRISTGAILVVGAGALAIFFVASYVAVSFLRMRQGEHPPLPIPAEVGQSKIGMVEQQMFGSGPLRGQRDRVVRLERLGSYGWVDRQAGVVHLPIDRAMQLVVEGQRPAPTPAPEGRGTGATGAQP
jgi:hypothetical protein